MSKCDLKLALFPMNICWDNISSNLLEISESVKSLDEDTDILVLPETFSTGFPIGKTLEEVRTIAETTQEPTLGLLKKISKERNVAICGSYIAADNDAISNRAFFMMPDGETAFADKRHLFTMAAEDKIFKNGDSRLSVEFKGWNISMIVCYDIRFPVWCRNVDNEYDLLIAVANWPEVRVDAWNKLLPARAIENEAYVCGVDCSGTDNKGFRYDGSSEVYDFKGKPVAQTRDNSIDFPFIYSNLSLDKLRSFREKFPAWKDADRFILE